MRRKDKEVTSREWQYNVLREGEYLTLALSGTDGQPYIVPMNYGFGDGYVIVHGALKGQKIDMIKANPLVCFNVVTGTEIIRNEEDPSEFSEKYRSVTGTGTARMLEDTAEKKTALQTLMKHYDGPTEPIPEGMLRGVSVIIIDIKELTGKVSAYENPDKK